MIHKINTVKKFNKIERFVLELKCPVHLSVDQFSVDPITKFLVYNGPTLLFIGNVFLFMFRKICIPYTNNFIVRIEQFSHDFHHFCTPNPAVLKLYILHTIKMHKQ